MRFSASAVANGLAWVVVFCLIGVAAVVANVLGFFGLMILGVLMWLICTLANLNQDAPTWGVEVFRARMSGHGSPEQRAAMLEERQAFVSPLRFYRWCGIGLALMGAAGFAWQQWR